MKRFRAPIALTFALLASACGSDPATPVASSDGTAAAASSTEATEAIEVATTPPLDAGSAGASAPPAQTEPATQAPDQTEAASAEQGDAATTPAPPTPVPPTAVPTPPPAPPAATVALPEVDVIDLASGLTVNLADFSAPGATLVWFWAPH